jgi:hypothetical protein
MTGLGYELWLINHYNPGTGSRIRHRAGWSGHLDRIYKVWPDDEARYDQCACHPAPNPAAADYRRRTKHRNRRRT